MKLSISNIAWAGKFDSIIYSSMLELGFEGLEIAPTRIIEDNPYGDLEKIKCWRKTIDNRISISSMQSIWYGISENIFSDEKSRQFLIGYTKDAIDFAEALQCKNLVFGCPKNRSGSSGKYDIAISFFREIGEYAVCHGTTIGVEAVSSSYGTDFLTNTKDVIDFIMDVGSDGIKLNLDVGAMIVNGESVNCIKNYINVINHVHFSEPGLEKLKDRALHSELLEILKNQCYDRYVSIEIARQDNISDVIAMMKYVKNKLEVIE